MTKYLVIDNHQQWCYDENRWTWGKATTETSSILIADREDAIWWKVSMWVVCENHSQAVMLKVE